VEVTAASTSPHSGHLFYLLTFLLFLDLTFSTPVNVAGNLSLANASSVTLSSSLAIQGDLTLSSNSALFLVDPSANQLSIEGPDCFSYLSFLTHSDIILLGNLVAGENSQISVNANSGAEAAIRVQGCLRLNGSSLRVRINGTGTFNVLTVVAGSISSSFPCFLMLSSENSFRADQVLMASPSIGFAIWLRRG